MNTDTHKCLSALPRKEASGGGGEWFFQGHWLRPAYITHYVFKSVPETLPQRTPHIENNNGSQCLPSAGRKKAIAARVLSNTSHELTRTLLSWAVHTLQNKCTLEFHIQVLKWKFTQTLQFILLFQISQAELMKDIQPQNEIIKSNEIK